jgi:hypothetical protein
VEAALGQKLQVKKIEHSDPEVAKHKVAHYPTIRFFPDGNDTSKFAEYTGQRTVDGLVGFVNDVMKDGEKK